MTEASPREVLEALQAEDQANQQTESVYKWDPELVLDLSCLILVFTLLVLLMASALLWRNKASGSEILKVFCIITIISTSALLIIVGYTEDQLTPVVGLFGALVGYLLGRSDKA